VQRFDNSDGGLPRGAAGNRWEGYRVKSTVRHAADGDDDGGDFGGRARAARRLRAAGPLWRQVVVARKVGGVVRRRRASRSDALRGTNGGARRDAETAGRGRAAAAAAGGGEHGTGVAADGEGQAVSAKGKRRRRAGGVLEGQERKSGATPRWRTPAGPPRRRTSRTSKRRSRRKKNSCKSKRR